MLRTVGLVALALVLGGAGGAAVPPRPTGLAATAGDTIALSWRDRASNETRYELASRVFPGGAWVTARLPRNTTSWAHSGLPAGTTVAYRVRACNRAGCSAWARGARATTTAPPDLAGVAAVGGCPVFPADNPWNRDVSADPVDPRSDAYIASISRGGEGFLHADFGSDPTYGIPYVVVPASQPLVPIRYVEYGDESDPGPFPIPPDAPVEAGNDRHVLVVQSGTCKLYELYHAERDGQGWNAGSGAVFDLSSNRLRPDTWTSADAAGLPILPGLVRYDEVAGGEIRHAVRFTVDRAQRAFIHPATHYGSSDDPDDPPMGLRLRLKASYDISGFTGQARVVLEALRRYGMIVADQGTSWFLSGATDGRWQDIDLDQLKTVPGSAFEVVLTGPILKP